MPPPASEARIPAHRDPVTIGQPHVQHRHIRPQRGIRASADDAVPASPTTVMSGSASSRSRTPDGPPHDPDRHYEPDLDGRRSP